MKNNIEPNIPGNRIELNGRELESVTGGAYDTITDEMRRLVDRLCRRANYDLFAHYADLTDESPLTSEQLTYWNERYAFYYGQLTPDEQDMVNAYFELINRD